MKYLENVRKNTKFRIHREKLSDCMKKTANQSNTGWGRSCTAGCPRNQQKSAHCTHLFRAVHLSPEKAGIVAHFLEDGDASQMVTTRAEAAPIGLLKTRFDRLRPQHFAVELQLQLWGPTEQDRLHWKEKMREIKSLLLQILKLLVSNWESSAQRFSSLDK